MSIIISVDTIKRIVHFLTIEELKESIKILTEELERQEEIKADYEEYEEMFEEQLKNERCID